MIAVIMAGGEGTRLRPLTCDCPKPMARLCGRPIMEYILELLAKNGIREAAVSLRYRPEDIRSYFGEEFAGVRLSYTVEDKPLGTAGGVRNAAGVPKDDILIMSGDALCDFNLSAAIRYHREKKAAATLLTTHVADPREYGLVVTEPSGRIRGFVEKPGWAQSVTDAVNTGVYILSPEAVSLIPPDGEYDFGRNLFPLMLSKDMPLYGFDADGYWCDIGDVGAYVSCQFDMLEGRVDCTVDASRRGSFYYRQSASDRKAASDRQLASDRKAETERPMASGRYTILPPVYIGQDVHIGNDAQIGPCAVIDDGCTIGAGTSVRNSVLLPDVFVGERCELRGALVCAGASLKKRAGMFEGSVAGAGSVIGKDASVSPGVRIWPGKQVEDGARAAANIQVGTARRGLFDDEGISGEVGIDLTPEICAKIGAAVGASVHGAVGVAHDGSNAGLTLKNALAAGVISTGARLYDFGSCFEAMAAFAVQFCGLEMGMMTRSAGSRAVLRMMDAHGLPLHRSQERQIESAVATGQIRRCEPARYGEPMLMAGIRAMYADTIACLAPEGLSGIRCTVRSANRQVQQVLERTLRSLGCTEGSIRIHVTAAGSDASFFDEEGNYIDAPRALALACITVFEDGGDVALPFDAPRAIDAIAAGYSRKVLRYLSCPAGDSDRDARRLAASQPFVRDGLQCALRVLSHLYRRGTRLCDFARELPPFAMAVRAVPLSGNPGRLLRRFSARGEDSAGGAPAEGVLLSSPRGRVLLSPLKRGTGLRIMAEAGDMEAAGELCAEYERKLQENETLDRNPNNG